MDKIVTFLYILYITRDYRYLFTVTTLLFSLKLYQVNVLNNKRKISTWF